MHDFWYLLLKIFDKKYKQLGRENISDH